MRRENLLLGIAGLLFLVLLVLSACVQQAPQAEPVIVPDSEQVTQTAFVAQGDTVLQATSEEENRLVTREAGLATEQADLATDQALATLAYLATRQAGGAEQTVAAQATASQVAYERTATADALEREASATVVVVIIEATAEEAAFRRTATAEALLAERTATAAALFAQQTATEQAYIRTATADAASRLDTATAAAIAVQQTATEQAQLRTAAAQAAQRDATRTAAALYAAQTATAEAAENRQQVVRYGIWGAVAVVALGLFVLLIVGLRATLPSFSALWLRVRGRELEPPPETCPPVIVQPDGSVEVPLLTAAEREVCDYPEDRIVEVLSWAREARAEGRTRSAPLGPPSAPGLRSIHTLRRVDQAAKAGVISPSLAAKLEVDWEREVGA
jgi:chemotaxis protein histidine kinase CheA